MQSLRSKLLLSASLLVLAACGSDTVRQVEETDSGTGTASCGHSRSRRELVRSHPAPRSQSRRRSSSVLQRR
jgi:hypothetical protein